MDGTLIRPQRAGLEIRARAVGAAVARIDLHRVVEGVGESVVTVDHHGALVVVAVAHEAQVHAALFQDGHEAFPHLDHLGDGVRVQAAVAVGRMMPERDRPLLRRRGQILAQPCRHRAVRRAQARHRVETHEMHVGKIERVILLGAGGDAARFARHRQREHVEVGNGRRGIRAAGRVVIANGRPERRVAQHVRVHVEDGPLVLAIGPVVVGVVAEQQDEIGARRVGGEVVVRIPDRRLGSRARPRIAQHPDAHRTVGAGQGSGAEKVIRARRQRHVGRAEREVVARLGLQVREQHEVIVGCRDFAAEIGERARIRPVAHPSGVGPIRAPADNAARWGGGLEIRPARHLRIDHLHGEDGGEIGRAVIVLGHGGELVAAHGGIGPGEREGRARIHAEQRAVREEHHLRHAAVRVGGARADREVGRRAENGIGRGRGEADGRSGVGSDAQRNGRGSVAAEGIRRHGSQDVTARRRVAPRRGPRAVRENGQRNSIREKLYPAHRPVGFRDTGRERDEFGDDARRAVGRRGHLHHGIMHGKADDR